jgi:DNA-binding CsgD family transcriptional regulator
MLKMNEAVERVRKGLSELERMLDVEAFLVMDGDGRSWLNENARELLKQKRIYTEDLLEWLKAGIDHLQKLSYLELELEITRLPGDIALVIMRTKSPRTDGLRLTYKEKEVLGFLVKGYSNKEIADSMDVSPGTVNTHLDNIYRKFGCSNRLEACFLALRNGFSAPARGRGRMRGQF